MTRSRLRRLPAGVLLCATIAFLNAAVWAVVTPSFQVPDEPVHAGYVQWMAETATLPRLTSGFVGPADESAAFLGTPWSILGHPTWSARAAGALQHQLRGRLGRQNPYSAGYVSNNPPLYHALETIPYRIAYSDTWFSRLLAMRLFSALFAGLTVAGIVLFLRELLPRPPWLATVGGLVCAFQPLLGFVSGGVNNDALLYAVGAWLFFLTARVLRRGLTPRRGLALGLVAAAGILTKGSAYGLLPGVAIAVAVALWRARDQRRTALLGAVTAAVGLAAPLVGLFALYGASNRSAVTATTGGLAGGLGTGGQAGGFDFLSLPLIREQLSYLWQFYLPRLPFLRPQFGLYPAYPLWDTMLQGFIGRFGWFYYGFAGWVYDLAAVVVVGLGLLAGRALLGARRAIWRRRGELAVLVTLALGLIIVVGVTGYRYRKTTGISFEQPRYLLPLLALYGGLIALAVRGAPSRLARPLAAGLVLLAMAHELFALVITIGHYYA